MLGDVEAEALLLQLQQLGLLILALGDRRVVTLAGGGRRVPTIREREVEDRRLAERTVLMLLRAEGECVLENVEHSLARRAGRVERAAEYERLERALVCDRRVDTLGEVPERHERPAFLARGDNRA